MKKESKPKLKRVSELRYSDMKALIAGAGSCNCSCSCGGAGATPSQRISQTESSVDSQT